MELPLEFHEAELLEELIEQRLKALAHEIHHTDTAAFKAVLKAEEQGLRAILGKLTVRTSSN